MERPDDIRDALGAMPGVAGPLAALSSVPGVWAVGGSVRDALLGREARELDVVAQDDAALAAALDALGGAATVHERFGTATVAAAPGRIAVDLVRARAESYPQPGALPDVRPGTLDEDLARRDITVNAIALRLDGPAELRAVPGARDDLDAGVLRVLHEDSFTEDPTRLWRLARYAARLGFAPDEGTRALAAAAGPDVLGTVSGPRLGQEVRLALGEPDPLAALRAAHALQPALLPDGFDPEPRALDEALALLPPEGDRGLLVLAACARPVDAGRLVTWLDDLAFPADARDVVAAGSREAVRAPLVRAGTASEIARAARGVPVEIVALAGGENARRWIEELRHVSPAVTGEDLLAAGIPQGPELGRRLARARDAQLDGRAPDKASQLAIALAADAEPGE